MSQNRQRTADSHVAPMLKLAGPVVTDSASRFVRAKRLHWIDLMTVGQRFKAGGAVFQELGVKPIGSEVSQRADIGSELV
mgnify:CR=1 FL=1